MLEQERSRLAEERDSLEEERRRLEGRCREWERRARDLEEQVAGGREQEGRLRQELSRVMEDFESEREGRQAQQGWCESLREEKEEAAAESRLLGERLAEIKQEKALLEGQVAHWQRDRQDVESCHRAALEAREKKIARLEEQLREVAAELRVTVRSRESHPSGRWESSAYLINLEDKATTSLNDASGPMLCRGLVVFKDLEEVENIRTAKTTFVCLNQAYGLADLLDLKESTILVRGALAYEPYPMPPVVREVLEYRLAVKEWLPHSLLADFRKAKSVKDDGLNRRLPSSESISEEEFSFPIEEIVGEEESPLPRYNLKPTDREIKELKD